MASKHLRRVAAVLGLCGGLSAGAASGSDLVLKIRAIEGPGWRADRVELRQAAPGFLQMQIARLTPASGPPIRDLQLTCTALNAQTGVRCDRARVRAEVPGLGSLSGTAQFDYRHASRWQATLELPKQGLRLALTQDEAQLRVDLRAREFSFNDASGRYATEKLSAEATLRWHRDGQIDIALDTHGGQAYVEPVFADFGVLPLSLSAALVKNARGWTLVQGLGRIGNDSRVLAHGQLDAGFRPVELDARVESQDLAPLTALALQPFLIGGRLEGITAGGRAVAQLTLRDGGVQNLTATLDGVSLKAGTLGLSLDGIAGDAVWSPTQAATSRLEWSGGSARTLPLGAAAMHFRAQGRDFELLEPWRQPLLGGALKVERLVLRGLGGGTPDAQFAATLEPIQLPALCRALGWPEFSGTLGGRLPGLSVRDDVWTLDGALDAQLFDGNLRVSQLQAVQPFGVLPRVMADLDMQRLDLERLTRTFSFGRITGRIDGEVRGLRLLNWSPVAFDGRLYSTPDDDRPHRISQRAIDRISALGGGPTGLLSRGVMSLFEDFAYDRIGIRCVLRDGVCQMSGVEPAPGEDGAPAYYLVKGAWLPRIDVVGYATRVSWTHLLSQLKSAQASGGPQRQ